MMSQALKKGLTPHWNIHAFQKLKMEVFDKLSQVFSIPKWSVLKFNFHWEQHPALLNSAIPGEASFLRPSSPFSIFDHRCPVEPLDLETLQGSSPPGVP